MDMKIINKIMDIFNNLYYILNTIGYKQTYVLDLNNINNLERVKIQIMRAIGLYGIDTLSSLRPCDITQWIQTKKKSYPHIKIDYFNHKNYLRFTNTQNNCLKEGCFGCTKYNICKIGQYCY